MGHRFELWSIWLDNEETAEPIKPVISKADEIALLDIEEMYGYHNGHYGDYYSCIIIER